jgi:hypothetical protein
LTFEDGTLKKSKLSIFVASKLIRVEKELLKKHFENTVFQISWRGNVGGGRWCIVFIALGKERND